MNQFKDLFSQHAQAYAKYRPHYPTALYDYLGSLAPTRERAWDCGTGNGQAAFALSKIFASVIATDPSQEQLNHALKNEKIDYHCLRAGEHLPLESASVDLVAVAQAAHWFNFEIFYAEVKRVLKKNGVIALWCYGRHRDIEPAIDPILKKYYFDIIGPYWDPEVKYVQEAYQNIPFPFVEIKPPPFEMSAEWNLAALSGYLWSWSSTQKYLKKHGENPMDQIEDELKRAWGDPDQSRKIVWDVHLRLGRNA